MGIIVDNDMAWPTLKAKKIEKWHPNRPHFVLHISPLVLYKYTRNNSQWMRRLAIEKKKPTSGKKYEEEL